MWEVLPVAAVPLFFAHRAYCAHVRQFEYEHRSLEAIESLDQGISVIDGNGRITLWNAALEEMVDCSRERALGRSLVGALPVLKTSGLPRAIDEAIARSESAHAAALWRAVRRGRRGSCRCGSCLPLAARRCSGST